MKNPGNNEFLPGTERMDTPPAGSRCKMRLMDQFAGFVLFASGAMAISMTGVVPAQAQQRASVESLNDISEVADRLYHVRESLKTVGTVSEAMAGSILAQFCDMTEVALHGSLDATIEIKGQYQGGGGEAIPSEGEYVASKHTKSWENSVSVGGKLSTIYNGCLNLTEYPFDIEPDLDIGATEDIYRYYDPPLQSASSMNRTASVSAGDDAMASAISGIVDVTPVELLNTLADGLVAMGLDPGNEAHVRSLLVGADWIGPANDFVGLFQGNPVEAAFGAVSSIQNLAGVFPIIGGFMTTSLNTVLNVVELGEPCGILVNVGIVDNCDAVESFTRDVSRFFYDGLRLIQDIPGTFGEISGAVSGVGDGIHDLNQNLSSGANHMLNVLNRIDNIDANMAKNINRVSALPNAVNELDGAYEDVRNQWNDFRGLFCDTRSGNEAALLDATVGIPGVCAIDFAFNPCAVEPEVKAQMQCELDYNDLEDQFGRAFEEVNGFIQDLSSGLDDFGNSVKDLAEDACEAVSIC